MPFKVNPYDWFMHLILPWTVLALLYAAYYARMVRGNLIETMGEDYIRTARAKGLSESKVVGKHGLRASLTPVVTLFGIDIALLARRRDHHRDGLQPPRNRLLGDPVHRPRRPAGGARGHRARVLPGGVLSLCVDIVYAWLDPRVRYS